MVTPFIEALVDDEIRRLVAKAIAESSTISTAECVAEVKRVYPTCGLSKRHIGDRVLMAAAAAGVAVEIGASNDTRPQGDGRAKELSPEPAAK